MLRASDITKSFGDLEILHGLSMQVDNGEIVAVTGPSGAGKTTLLQIIAGV